MTRMAPMGLKSPSRHKKKNTMRQTPGSPLHNKSAAAVAGSPRRTVSNKPAMPSMSTLRQQQTGSPMQQGDKTPPKANGVHGFMFSSPNHAGNNNIYFAAQTGPGSHQSAIHKSGRKSATSMSNLHGNGDRLACRKVDFSDLPKKCLFPMMKNQDENTLVHQSAGVAAPQDDTSLLVCHETLQPASEPRPREDFDHSLNSSGTNCTLFSPYRCHQHNYDTRHMRRLRQTSITEKPTAVVVNQHAVVEVDREVTYDCGSTQVQNVTSIHTELMVTQVQDIHHGLDVSDLESEDTLESFLTVARLKSLLPRPVQISQAIPPKATNDQRLTLVLDLDETLVHCSTDAAALPNYDLHFTVEFQKRLFNVFVQKRPKVLEFLKHAAEEFEVIIFTASQKIYADRLLDLLDPQREWTKYRLFRDSCVQVEGTFVKDLNVLGRDLSRVIIVDNALEAFAFQVSNGIPIKSWFNEPQDEELIRLWHFLQVVHRYKDVRPVLTSAFQLDTQIQAIHHRYSQSLHVL